MKFKHYLEHITGIGIYPMVSLFIFFLFFSALAIWAIKAKKTYIDEMKNIPLANKDNNQ
jgi:hypothetical protein